MAMTTEQKALVGLIRDSGMSIERFAEVCLGRSRSTVYRWLQGASPIPAKMVDWIEGPGPVVVDALREAGNEHG